MTPNMRIGPAGNGTESDTQQSAGQAPPRIRPTSDAGREARPWWRPGWGGCGCQHPRRHEDGCRWHLDPDHRVTRAAAVIVDALPAPRLSLDREYELICQIRTEPGYARRVAHWITSRRAA